MQYDGLAGVAKEVQLACTGSVRLVAVIEFDDGASAFMSYRVDVFTTFGMEPSWAAKFTSPSLRAAIREYNSLDQGSP